MPPFIKTAGGRRVAELFMAASRRRRVKDSAIAREAGASEKKLGRAVDELRALKLGRRLPEKKALRWADALGFGDELRAAIAAEDAELATLAEEIVAWSAQPASETRAWVAYCLEPRWEYWPLSLDPELDLAAVVREASFRTARGTWALIQVSVSRTLVLPHEGPACLTCADDSWEAFKAAKPERAAPFDGIPELWPRLAIPDAPLPAALAEIVDEALRFGRQARRAQARWDADFARRLESPGRFEMPETEPARRLRPGSALRAASLSQEARAAAFTSPPRSAAKRRVEGLIFTLREAPLLPSPDLARPLRFADQGRALVQGRERVPAEGAAAVKDLALARAFELGAAEGWPSKLFARLAALCAARPGTAAAQVAGLAAAAWQDDASADRFTSYAERCLTAMVSWPVVSDEEADALILAYVGARALLHARLEGAWDGRADDATAPPFARASLCQAAIGIACLEGQLKRLQMTLGRGFPKLRLGPDVAPLGLGDYRAAFALERRARLGEAPVPELLELLSWTRDRRDDLDGPAGAGTTAALLRALAHHLEGSDAAAAGLTPITGPCARLATDLLARRCPPERAPVEELVEALYGALPRLEWEIEELGPEVAPTGRGWTRDPRWQLLERIIACPGDDPRLLAPLLGAAFGQHRGGAGRRLATRALRGIARRYSGDALRPALRACLDAQPAPGPQRCRLGRRKWSSDWADPAPIAAALLALDEAWREGADAAQRAGLASPLDAVGGDEQAWRAPFAALLGWGPSRGRSAEDRPASPEPSIGRRPARPGEAGEPRS